MIPSHLLGIFAFLGLLSYVGAAGWTLDQSCSNSAAQIRASMGIAFQMADIANTQLGRNPVNSDVLAVYNHLFTNNGAFDDPNTLSVNSKVKGKLPKSLVLLWMELIPIYDSCLQLYRRNEFGNT